MQLLNSLWYLIIAGISVLGLKAALAPVLGSLAYSLAQLTAAIVI